MAVTSLTRRGGLLALGIALLAGCSQGSPASPPAQGPAFDPAPSGVPVSADPNVALLSAFDLRLDPVNGVAELNPLRSGAAIGDTWSEVGVTAAFKNMFGSNFEVEAIRPSGGQVIEVDFRTTHPFTPDRRPDLAIFNLKLWAVLDEFPQDIGGVQAVPGVVTNADGYGQMWSITHTDVSPTPLPEVQPYVILHEDPTSPPFDWQDPKGWNVLAPGQSTVDTVRFDLSGFGVVHLKLLLTADYGQSAVRATRQTPQYELPKFAGNAPWKIAVTEVSNTLVGNTSEGEATYRFDVWDWKHGQGLGSDVTQAWVRIPFILPDA
ncbi:MAG TPA: hypothetical protein VEI97_19195, partial [bacterium]|nr:hypothetical protein [bacterium]